MGLGAWGVGVCASWGEVLHSARLVGAACSAAGTQAVAALTSHHPEPEPPLPQPGSGPGQMPLPPEGLHPAICPGGGCWWRLRLCWEEAESQRLRAAEAAARSLSVRRQEGHPLGEEGKGISQGCLQRPLAQVPEESRGHRPPNPQQQGVPTPWCYGVCSRGEFVPVPGGCRPRRAEWESPAGRQVTDCRPAASGARGAKKSQKQPWPCARRHCGVNGLPSAPWNLSRLRGAGRGVRRCGRRDTETQRGRRRRRGRGRPGDGVPEGEARTLREAGIKTGGQRCRDRRDRDRAGEMETDGGIEMEG